MKEKKELHRYVYTIEDEKVKAFQEGVFANDSSGGIPLTFSTVMDFYGGLSFSTLTEALSFEPSCVLHGAQSYQYIKPVKAGETIEAIVFLTGKTAKRGLTFATLETEYKKDGETVLLSKSTLIERKEEHHV